METKICKHKECGQSSKDGKTHDHNKSVFCNLADTQWNKLK